MSYEKITVIGNIGDVRIAKSRGGTPYIRIGVAVSQGSGESRTTIWYSYMMFGGLVETGTKNQKLYKKGRLVLVEGRPVVEIYKDSQGVPSIDRTIVATVAPHLLDTPPSEH